jgi:hypothetical protein
VYSISDKTKLKERDVCLCLNWQSIVHIDRTTLAQLQRVEIFFVEVVFRGYQMFALGFLRTVCIFVINNILPTAVSKRIAMEPILPNTSGK